MFVWLAALCLQEEFADPSGARFSVPRGYEIRRENFEYKWTGTRCEFRSADDGVRGLLYVSASGWNVRSLADWRERSLRNTPGTDELTILRDERLVRARGEWIRREYRLVYQGTPMRYVDLYGARGRRNIELVLWTGDEDRVEEMRGIANSLELAGVWNCPRCSAAIGEPFSCRRCGQVGLPRHEGLAKLARKFEFQVVLQPGGIYPVKCRSGKTITGDPASDALVAAYSEKLARELAKYPDSLLRKLAVERFVLAQDIRIDGNKVGSVTDHEADTFHLEVRDGREAALFFEETIHHELFHVIDVRDDGLVSADAEWEKFNPKGFRYDPTIQPSGRFEDDLQGFLNTYSMTSVGEDKAEIYGQSVIRPKAVAARAVSDPVIAKKLAQIRRLVARFEPEMDERFWKKVE